MAELGNGQPISSNPNGLLTKPPNATESLGDDEIALYDRQIRLWGVQAQEKLATLHALGGRLLKDAMTGFYRQMFFSLR